MAVLKKLPDAENGAGVTCVDVHGQEWRITQHPIQHKFTLYKTLPNGFERVETASSPLDLYPRIDFGTGPEPEIIENTETKPDAKPKRTRKNRDKNPA